MNQTDGAAAPQVRPTTPAGERSLPFPDASRTFVIQLERERRRAQHVRRMSREVQLPLTSVSAVDGLALTEAELAEALANGTLTPEFRDQIAPGHLGCALSHLETWRRIAAENLHCALVLEDDFEPAEDFWPSFGRFYRALPADWHIAYLNLWNREKFPTRPLPDEPRVHAPSRTLGTVGYVLSRSGARHILEHILPFEDCVDDELDRLHQLGSLRAYAAPSNLIQHHDAFPSTLYEDGDARPFRWPTAVRRDRATSADQTGGEILPCTS